MRDDGRAAAYKELFARVAADLAHGAGDIQPARVLFATADRGKVRLCGKADPETFFADYAKFVRGLLE